MNKSVLLEQNERNADYSVLSNIKDLARVITTGSSVIGSISKPIAKTYHAANAQAASAKAKQERDAQRRNQDAKTEAWRQKNFDENKRYHDEKLKEDQYYHDEMINATSQKGKKH